MEAALLAAARPSLDLDPSLGAFEARVFARYRANCMTHGLRHWHRRVVPAEPDEKERAALRAKERKVRPCHNFE
eukprot:2105000-Pyramimonas_sp.AAC.1